MDQTQQLGSGRGKSAPIRPALTSNGIKINVLRTFLLFNSIVLISAFSQSQTASEIDPMLGADKAGNVFVGPTLPFGMAKPGPHYGTNESNAGWEARTISMAFRSSMFPARAEALSTAISWSRHKWVRPKALPAKHHFNGCVVYGQIDAGH